MSGQDENSNEGVCLTDLTDVYLDADDVGNIRTFFDHFEIPVTDYLDKEIKLFETAARAGEPKERLVALQNDLRAALCATIVESKHPLFTDDLFSVVRENAKQVAFLKHFDQQSNTELGITDLIKGDVK